MRRAGVEGASPYTEENQYTLIMVLIPLKDVLISPDTGRTYRRLNGNAHRNPFGWNCSLAPVTIGASLVDGIHACTQIDLNLSKYFLSKYKLHTLTRTFGHAIKK